MFDFNFCMKVPGKTFGYLPGYPVLAKRSFYKYPRCYDKEQQRQEKPQYYFFEFPQLQQFKL
jgi:hypothetical protein